MDGLGFKKCLSERLFSDRHFLIRQLNPAKSLRRRSAQIRARFL